MEIEGRDCVRYLRLSTATSSYDRHGEQHSEEDSPESSANGPSNDFNFVARLGCCGRLSWRVRRHGVAGIGWRRRLRWCVSGIDMSEGERGRRAIPFVDDFQSVRSWCHACDTKVRLIDLYQTGLRNPEFGWGAKVERVACQTIQNIRVSPWYVPSKDDFVPCKGQATLTVV